MNTQIQAVLDHYHQRIAQEQKLAREARGEDWRQQALLAVGPETGQLINILASSLKEPVILEIGTSFGYSGIWLAEAAQRSGGRVISLELHEHKSLYAQERAREAGLADWIEHRIGDALQLIDALETKVDFVLLDLWKDLYVPSLERFLPKLNPGAIIVADNILRPGGEDVQRYQQVVRQTPGISSVLLPVGSGLEISRYEPPV